MPLKLTEEQTLVVPERVIPPAEASKLWIASVVLNVPKNGKWSAVTEGHPVDDSGTVYFVNPVTGKDTTLRLESQDLMADAAKSPTLAAAINQVMSGIITAASEIKALRDAEKLALEESRRGEEVSG
jgi:hypothetical protein